MSYEFAFLLLAWAVAGGSPGPATLAISGTAMAQGRAAAVTLAAGVVLGSASWGIAAGFGLSALMLANAWVLKCCAMQGRPIWRFLR